MNDPLGLMNGGMRGPTDLLRGLIDNGNADADTTMRLRGQDLSRERMENRRMPRGFNQMPPAPLWNPNEPAPQEAEPLAPMAPPPPQKMRSVLKR